MSIAEYRVILNALTLGYNAADKAEDMEPIRKAIVLVTDKLKEHESSIGIHYTSHPKYMNPTSKANYIYEKVLLTVLYFAGVAFILMIIFHN